jgi:hypothetical protein
MMVATTGFLGLPMSDFTNIIGAVIIIAFLFKMITSMINKRRKPKTFEVARDSDERIYRANKRSIANGYNRDKVRRKMYITGDAIFPEHYVGAVLGYIPEHDMYLFYVKKKWWYFWRKPDEIRIEPEFCTDLNSPEIFVKARGFVAVGERVLYAIPGYGYKNLDSLWTHRILSSYHNVNLLTASDILYDTDWVKKNAVRGSIAMAMKEIGARSPQMPEMEEAKAKRLEQREIEKSFQSPPPGSSNNGGL